MSNTDPINQPKMLAKGYAVCSVFLASTCTKPLATNFQLTNMYYRIPVSTSSLIHTFIYFGWVTHLFCLMTRYCIIQFVILMSTNGAQLIVDFFVLLLFVHGGRNKCDTYFVHYKINGTCSSLWDVIQIENKEVEFRRVQKYESTGKYQWWIENSIAGDNSDQYTFHIFVAI